jgi:hypothetical protein
MKMESQGALRSVSTAIFGAEHRNVVGWANRTDFCALSCKTTPDIAQALSSRFAPKSLRAETLRHPAGIRASRVIRQPPAE